MPLPETILVALTLFAVTNADDLVLLIVFFGQPGARTRDIVLGQVAGLGVLTGVSFAAAWLAIRTRPDWLPWLGLVPLAIGLRWLLRGEGNDGPLARISGRTVAVVTIANGGDNLGTYIPTFALQSFGQRIVTAAVFAVLVFAWCAVARAAVRHPAWGPAIRRWSTRLGPWVLIVLGLWIVAHAPRLGLLR